MLIKQLQTMFASCRTFNAVKLLPVFFAFLLFSCSYGEMEEKNSELLQKADSLSKLLAARKDDSLILYIDSLMSQEVDLPPVFNPAKYDSATTGTFARLASQTGGTVSFLASSKLISTEIARILDSYAENNGDVVFLIDKTGSMWDDIENIKLGLKQVIESLARYKDLRLSIALYGDKNYDGKDWFSYREFGTDYGKAKVFLQGIQVTGGEDFPESVYDGYFAFQEKSFWQSSQKRMIILIGDAPSLEKPLSDHSLADVVASATADRIKMNFYPIVVSPYEGIFPPEVAKGYEKRELVDLVYPNPSQGKCRVSFSSPEARKIEIYNASAKLVYTQEVSSTEIDLDLSGQGNGLYILRAYDKDHNYDEAKIVVAK